MMSQAEWYYAQNGILCGPMELETLNALVTAEQVRPHDLVWRVGAAEWLPASRLEEMASEAATLNGPTTPPPIPTERKAVPPPLPSQREVVPPPLPAERKAPASPLPRKERRRRELLEQSSGKNNRTLLVVLASLAGTFFACCGACGFFGLIGSNSQIAKRVEPTNAKPPAVNDAEPSNAKSKVVNDAEPPNPKPPVVNDAEPKKVLAVIQASPGIPKLRFSPDSRMLAIGGNNGVILWDTEMNREKQMLANRMQAGYYISDIQFTNDGNLVAVSACATGDTSGMQQSYIKMWNTGDVNARRQFVATASLFIGYRKDQKTIVTAGDGCRIWDAITDDTNKLPVAIVVDSGAFCILSPDRSKSASWRILKGGSLLVKLDDVEANRPLFMEKAREKTHTIPPEVAAKLPPDAPRTITVSAIVTAMGFSRDGQRFGYLSTFPAPPGEEIHDLIVYDNNSTPQTIESTIPYGGYDLSLSVKNPLAAFRLRSERGNKQLDKVVVWNYKTKKEVARLDGRLPDYGESAFAPASDYLVTLDSSGVTIYDCLNQAVIERHTVDGAERVQFSPDGRLMAIGSKHGKVHLLSMK